ncbi:ATP-binding cassette domain-containing protein [Convivina praedatoris]|uniref:Vitamin B12 import ATP-binding protein BtuD n=1 Tax=Convivina praedatoris TaxID=2880963 RepID=A0ABM9D2V6_9LACO|nr:ABC transporter ATP-binding protein [Convivina sp. LMG 32447]CAH1855842.1 Vitamin B12 import ATP-binding protein BtuD [Convivina sp. LMG 32447]CAH1856666.1 Vitamin B12 import ATP-binding protein BtuD [Convivina sp. LMG 32447]CAH1856820.1 Vitamin B12 import ATP-binding protein BtuD [Convivina sp. LMG 32447]
MITFKNISKSYQGKLALNQINLAINSHELFVLVGPSGSGKTTLLRMINRLNTPTTGRIEIDGQDISQLQNINDLRHQMGYVLQSGALFPNLTVAQNIAVTLHAQHLSKSDQDYRIRQMLQRVSLDPDVFMNRLPKELSGGEAQRVGIVRALVFNPKIILMDESFSALDPLSRKQLQNLLIDLHQEFQMTIVFVTHDMQEALRLATRLVVLKEGQIQQIGTPNEIKMHPANQFVADFFDDYQEKIPLINDVLAAGLGQPSHQKSGTLSVRANIYELAQAFQQESEVIVGDKSLKMADLVTYLAQQVED